MKFTQTEIKRILWLVEQGAYTPIGHPERGVDYWLIKKLKRWATKEDTNGNTSKDEE